MREDANVTDTSPIVHTPVTELERLERAVGVTAPVTLVTTSVTGPWWPWKMCEACGCGYRAYRVSADSDPVRWKHGRAESRYCSNACRQRAYRMRHA
jgi:hypothetical protein